MKLISLTACLFLMVFSCNQTSSSALAHSLWKMRKVEILKNNELKKVIDTGSQYWNFKTASLIEIFDTHRIQNILHIRISNKSIRSYDNSGALQDEFMIRHLTDDTVALFSKKKTDDAEYNVIYYLDKVKDASAEEIKYAN